MVDINDFRVLPWGQESIKLEWSMNWEHKTPTPEIAIERSESPEGPFETIDGPEQREQYVDEPVPLSKKWRTYYYRLVITIDGQFEAFEGPERIRTDPDPIALEIIRRNELLLEEYISPDDPVTNGKCFIYPKTTEGERCPECWDEIKGRRSKNECDRCDGTGFLKGYLDPIDIYLSFSAPKKGSQPTQMGRREQNDNVAWTSNYPIIKPQDIIIEPYHNRRWRVNNVNPSQKGRYILRQTLSIAEIDPDHEANELSVPGVAV